MERRKPPTLLRLSACLVAAAWAVLFCFVAQSKDPIAQKQLEDPRIAAHWAAKMVGYESIGPALVKICERETGCKEWGEHEGDINPKIRDTYDKQVKWGRIDRAKQPWHPRHWGTGSPWGLSAVSHWRYMPQGYQPTELHDTVTAAVVAARKYVDHCMPRRKKRLGWCGPTEWLGDS